MEYIKGVKAKELNYNDLAKHIPEIAKQISIMHKNDIIHGDLTTSNIIIKDHKPHIIDFGLGFISKRIEDKATDLKVFFETLTMEKSKKQKLKNLFESTYKSINKDADLIISHLKEIEKRGRYK